MWANSRFQKRARVRIWKCESFHFISFSSEESKHTSFSSLLTSLLLQDRREREQQDLELAKEMTEEDEEEEFP